MSSRVVGNNVGWVACSAAAGTVAATVQPVHELAVIIPDAEGQYQSLAQSLAHGYEATVV
jgi:hypothetical protein